MFKMKNTVFLMINGKFITNEWYPTAEDAHERFVELLDANKAGKREGDKIIVCRLVDDYPMAYVEL